MRAAGAGVGLPDGCSYTLLAQHGDCAAGALRGQCGW